MSNPKSQHSSHPVSIVTADNRLHDINLRSADFQKAFELGYSPIDHNRVESAVTGLLEAVGADVRQDGLRNTPQRVARMYAELLDGYRTDPVKLVNNALFDVEYDDMIVVRDIEFSSLCEHHLLPFMGHAHVAYIPRGKVIGLSKIPRIVDMFSHRLQLQERLTRQIAEFLDAVINPQGVVVVLEGKHLCATIRGVEKHDVSMTTSAALGTFLDNNRTRSELLALLNRGQPTLV